MALPPQSEPSRLSDLPPQVAYQVIAAAQALDLGREVEAAKSLAPVLSQHPNHPEALRLQAGILQLRGDYSGALSAIRRALEVRPTDPLCHNTLGLILGAGGNFDEAIRVFRHACDLQPNLATGWYNLGVIFTHCVRYTEAARALQLAVKLSPNHTQARVLLADMLHMCGQVMEATTTYRTILVEKPWIGMAWWGLANIKLSHFESGDAEQMRRALRHPNAGDDDRIATGFALAKALDDDGCYAESLDALSAANAIARRRSKWDSKAFSAGTDAIKNAFATSAFTTGESELGREVIFIVGLPRSGTTLVEQILASQSQVEGAGELPDLQLVLTEESRRRGKSFPRWVAEMKCADWRLLGERYLDRNAHWRHRRPVFTDKLPNNWIYIGAIREMLPGARIVICRRDPLESCFSCYRQHLAGNEYARTFEDLGAFWHTFDRCAKYWANSQPAHVYEHDYETLITEPERSIRKLLDFCGLQFEESCIRFHETHRDVRSPSATQVRQPLRADTRRTQYYGALLDPLRTALSMPTYESSTV